MAWPMARTLASNLAWLSTTPFGSPVLPDVYWISAVDVSPVIGSGAAPSARGESPATLSTVVRLPTCAWSRTARRRPSGTVTSMRAPAFLRMPA